MAKKTTKKTKTTKKSAYQKEVERLKNSKKSWDKTTNTNYNKYANAYANQANTVYKRAVANNQATADSGMKTAYVSNALANTKMNDNLARQGITGGASETSVLNQANNYSNIQAGINNNLASNNTTAANTMSDNIASYNLTNNQNRNEELNANKDRYYTQKQNAWNKAVSNRNYKTQLAQVKASNMSSNQAMKALKKAKTAAEKAYYKAAYNKALREKR